MFQSFLKSSCLLCARHCVQCCAYALYFHPATSDKSRVYPCQDNLSKKQSLIRQDCWMRVNIVRGGAKFQMCLTWSLPCPHTVSLQPQEGSMARARRGSSIPRPAWPFWVSGSAFSLLCSPPLPTTRALLEGNSGEGRQAHVSWAQGQVTFPIQHLYKSYLMKLKGKKN